MSVIPTRRVVDACPECGECLAKCSEPDCPEVARYFVRDEGHERNTAYLCLTHATEEFGEDDAANLPTYAGECQFCDPWEG